MKGENQTNDWTNKQFTQDLIVGGKIRNKPSMSSWSLVCRTQYYYSWPVVQSYRLPDQITPSPPFYFTQQSLYPSWPPSLGHGRPSNKNVCLDYFIAKINKIHVKIHMFCWIVSFTEHKAIYFVKSFVKTIFKKNTQQVTKKHLTDCKTKTIS